MAYGLYLYKNVTTKGNRVVRLEIWSKDYTGSSAEIEAMGASPFAMSIDNSGGGVEEPLIKTNLNIVIKDTNQVDYDLFFTPDATKFKVIIKISGVDYWVGYLTPDSYSESLSYRSDIVLTARDNLGMLSEIKYERAGKRATMRTLLNEAMALISFGNTLEYRQKKTSGTLNILDAYIRCDRFIGKTWADVVQTILHDCGLQMRFVGAAKYAIYDIGEIVNLGTTISTQTFKFIEESGQREIIPAARTITLNQDYGSVDNSYDGVLADSEYSFRAARSVSQPVTKDISTPQVFTINYYDPFSIVWSGAGGSMGIVNPNEWNEAPSTIMLTGDLYTFTNYRPAIYYSQIMPITAGNVEVKFQVSNLVKYPATSGSDYVWKDYFFEYIKDPSSALVEWFGAKYQVKFRCNIFLQGATKTYIMRERWEEYIDEGPTATAKYLTFVLPSGGNAGEFPNLWEYNAKDEELKFNIQTIPEDGTLRIAFYPYELIGQFVQMYPSVEPQNIKDNIPLTYPILVKNISIKYPAFEVGGLESSAVINSAHNVAYNIDLELGQVPQGIGDSATMYGGLFNTGVNFYKALGDFFVTTGTEYHLSELIGREIANIYKEQREKLSGTIITDVNFSAMPSFGKTFTDGVKYYAINSGTLDFISEQMQVEMIEVEPYLYEDFTFIEATIESGGGSSMGAGEKTFVQWSAAGNAKRIYQLDTASEADQAGAFVFIDKSGLSAAKKVPISSLLVDAYTKTESDSRFASIDGDLTQDFSAKKLTTATLLLPQTAPILASGEVAIYSLDSGFSGELPSGAGSVTSIALTMPTGFSVSGSPITESGTFGVTFASGYFLPTTTQFASKLDVSLKGSPNGLAELDENGFVKNTQLPSYVDDVLEYGYFSELPVTGESGKIYVITNPLDTEHYNKTYRWSGTIYTEISASLALGETSSTAYRGDRGKIAYDHTFLTNNPHSVTFAQLLSKPTTLSGYGISSTDTLFDSKYIFKQAALNADGTKTFPLSRGISFYNNSTGSTGFPSQYGAAVDFSMVGGNNVTTWGRDFTLWKQTDYSRWYLRGYSNADGSPLSWNEIWHSGNLLNIGTTASSARTALELGSAALKSDTYFALLAGNIWQPFSASKLTSTTLLLPQTAPTLSSGEMAIYGLESGFSGEMPSGAGSVTSIALTLPTGLRVKKDAGGTFAQTATITESGEFIVEITSGYALPTTLKQTEWDSAFSAKHNAVTLGTANGLSLSTQVLSLGLASTSTNGALSSTDWNTFNGKQAKLIGTGASSLVRVNTLGTITYDDNTYLTGNQTITLSGIITGSGTTAITTAIADGALSIAKTNGLQTALDAKMATASYPDLVAIEALSGTSGFLKKTAANTWTLDTNTYLTAITKEQVEAVLTGTITSHNHNGTYALIGGVTTQDFQVKALTMNGALSGATTGSFSSTLSANRIVVTSTSNEKHLEFSRSDYNYIASNGHIGFVTGGTETSAVNQQVWIHSNGNTKIGAGSSSVPAYTLDVNGTGRFTSNVNIQGSLNITGTSGYSEGIRIKGVNGLSSIWFNAINDSQYDPKMYGLTVDSTGLRFRYGTGSTPSDIASISNTGNITASSTIQATTVKLTNLTDGYIPYHISDASGLGNSPISTDGTNVNLGSGKATISENINTNLRIPKVAPTNPTSGEHYFFIVE